MSLCPTCRLPESHECLGISRKRSFSEFSKTDKSYRKAKTSTNPTYHISHIYAKDSKHHLKPGIYILFKLFIITLFVSGLLYFGYQASEIHGKILTEVNKYKASIAIATDYNTSPVTIVTDNNDVSKIEQYSGGTVDASQYMSSPKTVNYEYVLRGKHSSMSYTVYGGMNNQLKGLPREITYYATPPTNLDFIMRDLNDEDQKQLLNPLIEEIQNITSNKDDQARIAISLVQNIDYDWDGFKSGNIEGKYPYEVLYTGCGVCSEKSELLVYLLRDLGYGVVVFRFDASGDFPGHDAVGIKCPQQYSYRGTGYCFVESTTPSIITDSSGDYSTVGTSTTKLTNMPEVLKICDGNSFDSVSEEYNDAVTLNSIRNGKVLDKYNYNRWLSLVNKYGIKTTE